MPNIPPELLYIIAFAAIGLVQYLLKRFAKRPEPEVLEELPPAQDAPVPADEPLPEVWGRPASAVAIVVAPRIDRPRDAAPATTMARRPSAARLLLGTKSDLRRTIVIMSVLGPCRAQEPPDSR